MKKSTIAFLTVFLCLIIDQASKFWVKLNMQLSQEIPYIGNWAKIHFVENEGMAFGMSWGAGFGKIMLTLFRIIVVFFLINYIRKQVKNNTSTKGFVFTLSLILAGAMGNIFDCLFYGKIFSDSSMQVATLFPKNGGYAPFFLGKVVDMFYFPIAHWNWPSWLPIIGNSRFEFFNFIFNFADATITVGLFAIILFYKDNFSTEK